MGPDNSQTATFYNDAKCLIALYDVTDKDSVKNCNNWLSYGDRYIGGEYLKALVCNKIDLERVVGEQEGPQLAANLNCKHFEISCKTNEGIKELYDFILKTLFQKVKTNRMVA